MLNAPLVEDKVALRGVISYRDEGGYIDNVRQDHPSASEVDNEKAINAERSWGARLAVVFTPTDRLEITPSIFRQELAIDDTPEFEESFRDLAYFNKLVSARQENNFTLYGLEASYDFGDWQLFSSTTFFESDFLSVDDFTKFYNRIGIPPDPGQGGRGLQDIRSERTSQELRLAYSGGDRWDGVFGVFYMEEKRFFRQDLPNDDNFSDFPPPTILFTGTEDNVEDQVAVFGEVNFSLTDRLDVTAGVRWFDAEQEVLTIFDGVLNGGLAVVSGKASDSSVSPKLQVSYHANDNNMVYVSTAKGFRPGGPTNLVPPSCDQDLLALGLSEPLSEFGADDLWNYELGIKSTLADNRLVVNATTFFIEWDDVQQAVRLDCGFGFVGNVGAAESKGFELEVTAAPNDHWNLFASMGYTNAEFTRTSTEVGVVAGDRIPNVPELTASASAQYNFEAWNNRDAHLRADFQYVDESVADQSAGPGVQFRPSYQLLNARFAVMLTENLQFSLFADNLTDERPVLAISSGTDPNPLVSRNIATSRPRTIGMKFSYSPGY
jgi:iron complex outermembrane recepter protein